MALTPFADDTASISIGTLVIENGIDRVAIYGSVDITRDQQGLDHARALLAIALKAVQLLEGERELPAALPAPTKSKATPEPFD